jgi:hypothetical protein
MGSGFDNWIYWLFITLAVTLCELLLNDVCLTISMKNLGLTSDSRIHECTAFYNCHAAGIEVTMSNSSYVLLCCYGNAFVNIRCRGNKCLRSRCLAKIISASAIISAFSQCLPSCCLTNGHIPSQYLIWSDY